MKTMFSFSSAIVLALSMNAVSAAQKVRPPIPQIKEQKVPDRQTRPRPLPVPDFNRPDLIGGGKINFTKADYTLTRDKIKAMRTQSGRAPIFGSQENSERRFSVVLADDLGILKGRGGAIARQRDKQVQDIVSKLLRDVQVNRQVMRSRFVTSGAVNAVTLRNPSNSVLNRLAQDPRVLYIEQVTTDRINGVDTPPQSWGLDRIDQRLLPLDSEFHYSDNGGVDIWVIDSGIRPTHNEFTGRIASRVNLTSDGNPDDCNGHGTHVAGTAAGSTYGVFRQADLHIVKVFSCGNSTSSNITQDGLNHVYNYASGPSIVNLSLGGTVNSTTNNLVKDLTDIGVVVVAAAGNNAGSACLKSPASAPSAITVAASDSADGHAFFGGGNASNAGGCVDIYAPGKNIKSAWHTGDNANVNLQGTSMASPHVAGVAAALLSDSSCESAWKIHDQIVSTATLDVINIPTGAPPTPNRLVYYEIPTPTQSWSDYLSLYSDYSQCLTYFAASTLTTDLNAVDSCMTSPPAPGKTLKAVRIKGHTDSFGEPAANMIRSCNYAHVVTQHIRDNYPNVAVIESAHGETDLAISTTSNVHEQLNRRVEMLLLWD